MLAVAALVRPVGVAQLEDEATAGPQLEVSIFSAAC